MQNLVGNSRMRGSGRCHRDITNTWHRRRRARYWSRAPGRRGIDTEGPRGELTHLVIQGDIPSTLDPTSVTLASPTWKEKSYDKYPIITWLVQFRPSCTPRQISLCLYPAKATPDLLYAPLYSYIASQTPSPKAGHKPFLVISKTLPSNLKNQWTTKNLPGKRISQAILVTYLNFLSSIMSSFTTHLRTVLGPPHHR